MRRPGGDGADGVVHLRRRAQPLGRGRHLYGWCWWGEGGGCAKISSRPIVHSQEGAVQGAPLLAPHSSVAQRTGLRAACCGPADARSLAAGAEVHRHRSGAGCAWVGGGHGASGPLQGVMVPLPTPSSQSSGVLKQTVVLVACRVPWSLMMPPPRYCRPRRGGGWQLTRRAGRGRRARLAPGLRVSPPRGSLPGPVGRGQVDGLAPERLRLLGRRRGLARARCVHRALLPRAGLGAAGGGVDEAGARGRRLDVALATAAALAAVLPPLASALRRAGFPAGAPGQ